MSDDLFQLVPSIPLLRPALNIGCGIDIITGTYHIGRYGESICNGGLTGSQAIQGPPNASKTTLTFDIELILLERYRQYRYNHFCTEGSGKYERFNKLAKKYPKMSQIEHGDPTLTMDQKRVIITSQTDMFGDVFLQAVEKYAKSRIKEKKKETPFKDGLGGLIKILMPFGVGVDSLTMMNVSTVETNIVSKNKIGDAGGKIQYMHGGLAKKQFIDRIPNVSVNGGIIFVLTSHVGKELEMDPYAPKRPKLAHGKRGIKPLGVCGTYEYVNGFIMEIHDAAVLKNDAKNTGVLYPATDTDRVGDGRDLMEISVKFSRSKGGGSGGVLDLVVSQRDGLLSHLTIFHNLKESCGRYGLEGNDTTYHMVLLPEVNISRTTVRNKLNEIPNLRRAMELTFDLFFINTDYGPEYDYLKCSIEDLYKDLTTMGFNWDILLNTGHYWVFVEDEPFELPYLSAMDLLRMRVGIYFPYFLEDDKITYKKSIKTCLTT